MGIDPVGAGLCDLVKIHIVYLGLFIGYPVEPVFVACPPDAFNEPGAVLFGLDVAEIVFADRLFVQYSTLASHTEVFIRYT